MLLNKKSLRQYADPGWAIPAGHGLLRAEQVRYIVRTAVRIIDHHRILLLYVYDREQALQGVSVPRWTMFQQGRDDYITLERLGEHTKWRTACFDSLGRNYCLTGKCAFYSQQDEARVSRYFRSSAPGFSPLVRAQSEIMGARLQDRLRQRDRKILKRMKTIRALPRGLNTWIRRSVMPAYFFYDYKREKAITGTCSSCGSSITLAGVKYNGRAVCPHCGRELVMKSRGRCKRIYDRDTCQVVQRVSDNEVVIGIIKVWYSYDSNEPSEHVYENARIFVRLDESGNVCQDNYYYRDGAYEFTPWKQGERPTFYPYQYNFEADTCGYVYLSNLPAALAGTPWQYCPVEPFCEHFRVPMQLAPFLNAHIEHPRLEHLVKVGFFSLALDLAYNEHNFDTLDETQNRTHRMLRVAPEDVHFLQEQDPGLSTLRVFQTHCRENLKGRQELFRWTHENKVVRDVDKILPNMTVHKFLRYMNEQYSFLRVRMTGTGEIRYSDMQALVTEYRDYLNMCENENYDLKNSFVLFPKDLQKAHDAVAGRIKHRVDAKARRKFISMYKRIGDSLAFESQGMTILCPAAPRDIISEGQALHHCVGGYVKYVADGQCLILFVRRCEDIAKPFYTIELRDREVVQLRGANNMKATPEVQAFVDRWTREVLSGVNVAA